MKKDDSELSSFDLSYHHHDPSKEEIIVYNNGKGSKGPVKLVLINEKKQQFSHSIEKIAARTGILIKLADLDDKNEMPFSGKPEQVEIHFNSQKAVFVPEGNKFKRKK